jgi:hypothetical protein
LGLGHHRGTQYSSRYIGSHARTTKFQ